jgi:hypothetical protein
VPKSNADDCDSRHHAGDPTEAKPVAAAGEVWPRESNTGNGSERSLWRRLGSFRNRRQVVLKMDNTGAHVLQLVRARAAAGLLLIATAGHPVSWPTFRLQTLRWAEVAPFRTGWRPVAELGTSTGPNPSHGGDPSANHVPTAFRVPGALRPVGYTKARGSL